MLKFKKEKILIKLFLKINKSCFKLKIIKIVKI